MNKPQSTIGAVETDGVERQHRDEANRIRAEKDDDDDWVIRGIKLKGD